MEKPEQFAKIAERVGLPPPWMVCFDPKERVMAKSVRDETLDEEKSPSCEPMDIYDEDGVKFTSCNGCSRMECHGQIR